MLTQEQAEETGGAPVPRQVVQVPGTSTSNGGARYRGMRASGTPDTDLQ